MTTWNLIKTSKVRNLTRFFKYIYDPISQKCNLFSFRLRCDMLHNRNAKIRSGDLMTVVGRWKAEYGKQNIPTGTNQGFISLNFC